MIGVRTMTQVSVTGPEALEKEISDATESSRTKTYELIV